MRIGQCMGKTIQETYDIQKKRQEDKTLSARERLEKTRRDEAAKHLEAAAIQRKTMEQKLAGVLEKMKGGKRLTSKDYRALRSASPEYYHKALFIKTEREQYRRDLNRCRSRRQVKNLRLRKTQQFVLESQSIRHASMDAESRLKANEFLSMRHQAIEQEHREFKTTLRYQTLPEKRSKKERAASGFSPPSLPLREAVWRPARGDCGKAKPPGAGIDLLIESLEEKPSFLSEGDSLFAWPEPGKARGRNIAYRI